MCKHYDMILFENCLPWETHKIDMILIANIFSHYGLKIAILDIYGQDKGDYMEQYPLLHLSHLPNKLNYASGGKHNKLVNFLSWIRVYRNISRYYKCVIPQILPLADMFYCGSLQNKVPLELLKISKPCFFWGLRAYRFDNIFQKMIKNFVSGYHILCIKKNYKANENMYLFVSNEVIMKEHIKLGFPSNRIIIRPERYIYEIPKNNIEKLSKNFSFLTIGNLRKSKRVDFSVTSYLKADINNSLFIIAGAAQDDVDIKLKKASNNDNRIIREQGYITPERYKQLMTQMHFLVLADVKEPSSMTNGTLSESLCNLRPFIAPNYPPYSTMVEKYGIGICYDPDIEDSQAIAMQKANQIGCEKFIPAIKRYLNTIMFDKVAKQVYNDTINSINKLN